MDWRLFATKPKGGYIRKPAVLNILLEITWKWQEGLNNGRFFQRKEGEAMCREQKTGNADYLCEGTLETESNKGVRSISPLEIEEKNSAERHCT